MAPPTPSRAARRSVPGAGMGGRRPEEEGPSWRKHLKWGERGLQLVWRERFPRVADTVSRQGAAGTQAAVCAECVPGSLVRGAGHKAGPRFPF